MSVPPGGGRSGGPGSGAEGRDGSGDEQPTLTLSEAMKLAGFAATGGMAKRRIQAGDVAVNGEIETRRKRRLRAGDEITVDDETFIVELEDEVGADGDDGAASEGDDPSIDPEAGR